ncbi:hypothetical protein B0H10DRAFT_2203026 [Mycena sp. CBHHK59/15]|nr:hypothetical protein B0H10DRAFT_2203026 [Mycena sp. CBHHK59/15]
MDRYNDDGHSQAGQQYSYTPEDPVLLVDQLSNSYQLDSESRGEMHAFLTIARSLRPLELKIALIQQATALQTQQMLQSEVTSACKAYLEKHQAVNGLQVVFATSARKRVLKQAIRRQASYTKTYVHGILLPSVCHDDSLGTSLTTVTGLLARKCLGGSENATPKLAIWVAILRSFACQHPELFKLKDDSDSANQLPEKQTHAGDPKHRGRVPKGTDFWSRIAALWKEKTDQWGSDLKATGWAQYINEVMRVERSMYPDDTIPLIPFSDDTDSPPLPRGGPSGLSGSRGSRGCRGSRAPVAWQPHPQRIYDNRAAIPKLCLILGVIHARHLV